MQNKCISNTNLYQVANSTDNNVTQQLNSTVVDPANVPTFGSNSTNSTNPNNTTGMGIDYMSGLDGKSSGANNNNSTDDVVLSTPQNDGAGMGLDS